MCMPDVRGTRLRAHAWLRDLWETATHASAPVGAATLDWDTIVAERRRAPRLVVPSELTGVSVALGSADGSGRLWIPGRLLDLSPGGAQIVCRPGMHIGRGGYLLRLTGEGHRTLATLPVQVRWLRTEDHGRRVGMRFINDRATVTAALRGVIDAIAAARLHEAAAVAG